MKKHLSSILKFAISLGIGIALVYWSLSKITTEQKQQIYQSFKEAKYNWLYVLIFFGLASNFFRAQRWRLLLKPLGYFPGYWNTFFAVMIMFFANLAFPRLGEVMRCTILYKYEKVPVEKSLGTMVLERIIDLVCILLIGLIIVIIDYDRFYNFLYDNLLSKINPTKYLIILAVFFAIAAIGYYIIRKKGIDKKQNLFFDKLKGLIQGIVSIKDLENKWEFIFHTIAIWACYILMPYFGFKALSETAELGLMPSTASVFFGGFAMVATQGGIGAYQIVVQKVLALYNISDVAGFSYGWLSWSVQTFFVIIGGILSLISLAIINKNSEKSTEVN